MHIRSSIISILIIGFIFSTTTAQIGIPTFEKGENSLKNLLSEARALDQNILVISYSAKAPTDILPEIKNPDSILLYYPMVTDVIDPFLEMSDLISYRLKQYSNPGWTIIHPENRILFYANSIKNDEDLIVAAAFAESLKAEYDKALELLDDDKNDIEGLKLVIRAISKMYEQRGINRYINRFLKQVQGNESEELPFLIEIAERSPGNGNLDKFLINNKEQVIRLSSLEKYTDIRQKAIIAELKNREIYEPYMIWKKFEDEFGMQADSLYRLQAIHYFAKDPEAKEDELHEIIAFLDLYPDTPWETLDPLYGRALKLISSQSDLEIMLDLIGGQIFQGKHYRKLDYRAIILYRLGQKERSLKLISEVMSLAQEHEPSYRSMIYMINKK